MTAAESSSFAVSSSPQQAYKRVRWSDLLHLTPEQAVTVMCCAYGVKICALDAERAMRRARRRAEREEMAEYLYETACNFQRDQLGKKLGGNVGTTQLYKLITGKRMGAPSVAIAV